MRILLVEDDTGTSAYIRKNLTAHGHHVDHVIDGIQGQRLAEENAYDVLIVDRMLPEQDGLTLIGALRAGQIKTPVLILSALADVNDRVDGLRAGADDYLIKPFAFAELLAYPAVLPGTTTYTRGILERAVNEAGIALNVAMATNYLETLHMLVATGLGWSLLPATVLDEEVQQITVDGMRLSRRLGAVTHKKRSLSNAGNAMIRTCLEA